MTTPRPRRRLADADRAIDAAHEAGVPVQVGFNRRYDAGFRAAHDKIAAGAIGRPQQLRSLTRDPDLADPARIPPWTRTNDLRSPPGWPIRPRGRVPGTVLGMEFIFSRRIWP